MNRRHQSIAIKRHFLLIQTSILDDSPRLIKEVEVIIQNGHDVTLIGWNRWGKKSSKKGKIYNLKEIILKLKAPNGIGNIPFLFVWWLFEFFWLIHEKYDCIHVINFDSIIPAVIIGRLRSKPIIYEILDLQTEQEVFPQIIKKMIFEFDKMIMHLVDAIILVDEMQIEAFRGVPNSRIAVIYDSPPDFLNKLQIHDRSDIFTIFYAGKLDKIRRLNINNIFEAVSEIDNIEIIIAGYGDLIDEIKEWSHKMPKKILFIGRISYREALERSIKSDLLFSIRDPRRSSHKYICGCKMLEAMMCSKPILVSKGTSTAIKVSKEKCGIVIDADKVDVIKNAIIKLKENKELCSNLGINGRKAYERFYSWKRMEKRLSDLYSNIIKIHV